MRGSEAREAGLWARAGTDPRAESSRTGVWMDGCVERCLVGWQLGWRASRCSSLATRATGFANTTDRRQLLLPVGDNYFCRSATGNGEGRRGPCDTRRASRVTTPPRCRSACRAIADRADKRASRQTFHPSSGYLGDHAPGRDNHDDIRGVARRTTPFACREDGPLSAGFYPEASIVGSPPTSTSSSTSNRRKQSGRSRRSRGSGCSPAPGRGPRFR